MSESILKALMRLFAIIASFDQEDVKVSARSVVESYLKQLLNQELIAEYLRLFDEFYSLHHSKKGKKRLSANSVKVLAICEQINEELQQNQKVLVLLQLLEFISHAEEITEMEYEFVKTVADVFNISEDEFFNCKSFILDTVAEIPGKDNILIVDKDVNFDDPEIKHIYSENLNGKIIILNITSTNMFVFRYLGDDNLTLNGQIIHPKWGYILDKGSSIRSPKISPVYYSDVTNKFLHATVESKVLLTARDVIFRFKNSENGIQKFNFSEGSGELIGIMGGSGVGKSTLLNVLNGNLKINSGQILINGLDIYEDKDKLEGIIGFIPQDDLLMEELTVYQNLYYNAKLCFNNLSDEEIRSATDKVLMDLDLYAIRGLKVGSPLKKFISGGQRKRLNIALELIREPSILYVDEPTSGLSSMDSEMVMDLLKEQTLKGKLVIVNIHQPSSDIYKLFDKIMIMDKGGYTIYYGNPLDAVTYFKTMSRQVNADVSECLSCGNVNPETVLQTVEAKVVDEYGKLTRNRKVEAKEWYDMYVEHIESKHKEKEPPEELPKSLFKIPNLFKQFIIFTIRDILSKLTDRQYLVINFLEAPLLAFILGYFTKYIAGTLDDPDAYVFSENVNLTAYIFMAVVVALFLGMSVSAEEIIKDRKILQRERFLNLSRFSYLNSKIMIMFLLSAIQTISFVLIGNWIVGLQGMTFSYWLVLFTTSCFANMLGLNISSALDSVVTIYILIPFILVPQLLLSGTIVKFDELHKDLASQKHVPFVGDMMTSRWAYEALVVHQFKDNKFEKHFYPFEQTMSRAAYIYNFLIPELEAKLNACEKNIDDPEKEEEVNRYFKILYNEFKNIGSKYSEGDFKRINDFNIKSFDKNVLKGANDYLSKVNKEFVKKYNEASKDKDKKFNELIKEYGDKETVDKIKRDYHNMTISDLVKNKHKLHKIVEEDDRLLQLLDPVYMLPENNYGRAQFFAPVKKFFGMHIDTFWFNIMVIWFTSLIMYFTLWHDTLRKLIEYFGRIRFKK